MSRSPRRPHLLVAHLLAAGLVTGSLAWELPTAGPAEALSPAEPFEVSAGEMSVADASVTELLTADPGMRRTETDRATADIVSLVPARFLDSRVGASTFDGVLAGGGRVAAGAVVEVPVAGRGGVPVSGVSAVVVNVTAVDPVSSGYVTAFPCGVMPVASAVNFSSGVSAVANEIVAPLSASGSVCLYSSAEIDLLADVVGYVRAGADVVSLVPARFLDSRVGASTFDGVLAGGGRVAAGAVVEVPVAGRGGVPVSGVSAVVVNVTAVDPVSSGYVTAFPCGVMPVASAVNFSSGVSAVANEIVAPLSASGSVCLFSSAEIDLLADVVGHVAEPTGAPGEDGADAALPPPGLPPVSDEDPAPAPAPDGGDDAVVDPGTGPGGDATPPSGGGGSTPGGGDGGDGGSGSGGGDDGDGGDGGSGSDGGDDGDGGDGGSGSDGGDDGAGGGTTPPEVDLTTAVWRAAQHDVTFTSDGADPFELAFIATDAASNEAPLALPEGSTLVRHADIFDVEITPEGTVVISDPSPDGDTIGAEYVGVLVPGQDEPVTFWITSYRVKQGVQLVDLDDIVVGAAETGVDPDPGPFTIDELMARFRTPAEGVTGRIPVILRGEAPAPGVLLSGPGVFGKVVPSDDVPDAPPTLQLDGLVLVTLEMVPPDEIFQDLDVAVDLEELIDAGLYDPTIAECDPAVPDGPGCLVLVDDPGAPVGPVGFRRSSTPAPQAGSSPCPSGGGASLDLGSFTVDFALNPTPIGNWDTRVEDGRTVWWTVSGGIEIQPTLTIEASLSIELDLTCRFNIGKPIEVPTPGPTAVFLSGTLQPWLEGEVSIAVSGPGVPKITIECSKVRRWERGVVWSEALPLTYPTFDDFRSPLSCVSPSTPTGGGGDAGIAAEVDITAGVYLGASVGVRFGSKFTAFFGVLVGNALLGALLPFYGKLGPQLAIETETYGNVVSQRAHRTGATAQNIVEIGVEVPDISPIFEFFSVAREEWIGITTALELTQAIPLAGVAYPGAEPVSYSIDGSPAEDTPRRVKPGETITVTTELPPLQVSAFGFDLFATEVQLDPDTITAFDVTDGRDPVAVSLFDVRSTSNGAVLELAMTDELCATTFNEEREFAIAGKTEGFPYHPLFLGTAAFSCDRFVTFDANDPYGPIDESSGQSRVTVELDRGRTETTVAIKQRGFLDLPFQLTEITNNDPDGLVSVTPLTGTLPDERQLLELRLDCPEDDEDSSGLLIHELTVDSKKREAVLEVSYDCRPTWIDVDPIAVSIPAKGTAAVVLTSEGPDPDTWTASVPGNVGVAPESGDLGDQGTTTTVLTIADARLLPCGQEHPARTEYVTFSTNDRGTATLRVDLAAREKEDCRSGGGGGPGYGGGGGGGGGAGGVGGVVTIVAEGATESGKSGSSKGDPHITSFDGLSYDAMVRGEYVYAADDQVRIVARHEDSTIAVPVIPATSMTALAVERLERVLELYATGSGVDVLVDGALATVRAGDTLRVDSGFTVHRVSNDELRVEIDAVRITIDRAVFTGMRPLLSVSVYPGMGSALRGLLGTFDGDASNDLDFAGGFALADGSTRITMDDVHAHGDVFYAFTESWRLQDQADSPFTRSYPAFGEPNPVMPDMSEALADVRAAVEADPAVQQYLAVCGETADTGRLLDIFAVDIANGATFADLVDFGCRFTVVGLVATDLTPDGATRQYLAIDEAIVDVTAPGLLPCRTITTLSGSFTCSLVPDPDHDPDLDGPVGLPFDALVEVRAPRAADSADPIGTSSATIEAVDDVTEAPPVIVDLAELRIAEVTGTFRSQGVVQTRRQIVTITTLDSSGAPVAERDRFVTPDSDGAYSLSFTVPENAEEVSVRWRVTADDDDPFVETAPVGPGLTQIDFSPHYDPPVAVVTGGLELGAVVDDLTDVTISVTATATTPDRVLQRSTSGRPGPTGGYTLPLVLPRLATSAELVVEARDGDLLVASETVVVDPLVPGNQLVSVTLVPHTPTLELSGTLIRDGAPVTSATDITVSAPGGWSTDLVVVPGADGTFGTEVVTIPLGAETVTVTARMGQIPANDVSLTVPVVDDRAVAVLDVDIDIPRLLLTGAIHGIPAGRTITLTVLPGGDVPGPFGTQVTLDPALQTEYVLGLELPSGTPNMVVFASLSDAQYSWPQRTVILAPAGTTTEVFDLTIAEGGRIEATLSLDGVVYEGPADIVLRQLDPFGEVLDELTETFETDADGRVDLPLPFVPGATSFEIGWLIGPFGEVQRRTLRTDTEVYSAQLFASTPQLWLGGRIIAEGGVPVTDPVTLAVQPLDGDDQALGAPVTVAVTPEADGTYWTSEAIRFVGFPDVVPEGAAVSVQDDARFGEVVRPLRSSFAFFDIDFFAYATPPSQRLLISGTATLDAGTLPGEVTVEVALTRLDGAGAWTESMTVTADPDDGSYSVVVEPGVIVTGGSVTVRTTEVPFERTVRLPALPDGDTEVVIDALVQGRLLRASGTFSIGGAPAVIPELVLAPDLGPTIVLGPTEIGSAGIGSFVIERLLEPGVAEVVPGVIPSPGATVFEDDIVFAPAIPVVDPVVEVADIDIDIEVERPSITVSGTVTGAETPFTMFVAWRAPVDSAPAGFRSSWQQYVPVTPVGGSYSVSLDGPARAEFVRIVAPGVDLVDIELATVTGDEITADVVRSARQLYVVGQLDDPLGVPDAARPLIVEVGFLNAAGIAFDATTLLADPSPVDGSFELYVDVPDATVAVELEADYRLAPWSASIARTGPSFVLVVPVPDVLPEPWTATWTATPTVLQLTGDALAPDGSAAADLRFPVVIEAYSDEPITNVLLARFTALLETDATGAFLALRYLPSGTDRIRIISEHLADGLVQQAVTPGLNSVELDLVVAGPVPFEISADLSDGGRTLDETPTIRVRSYVVSEDERGPWGERALREIGDSGVRPLVAQSGGGSGLIAPIPAMTEVVRLSIAVGAVEFEQFAELTPSPTPSLYLAADIGGTAYVLTGSLDVTGLRNACPAPLDAGMVPYGVISADDPESGAIFGGLAVALDAAGEPDPHGRWSITVFAEDWMTGLFVDYDVEGVETITLDPTRPISVAHLATICP